MKILFIVPILNSGEDLIKFSNSLSIQTFKNWRVLFVDGGSKKKDLIFLSKLKDNDQRFDFIKQKFPQKGIFGAMNEGFELAEPNEYIIFWGSDDFADNKFTLEELCNRVLKSQKETSHKHLYIFKARYYEKKNNKIGRTSFFPSRSLIHKSIKNIFPIYLVLGFTPPHQATLFTPMAREIQNKYSCKYRMSADLDYFLRLSKKIRVTFETFDFNIVTMSNSGTSARNLYQRLNNVFSIYFKFYGPLFFIPIVSRYFIKIQLKIFSLLKKNKVPNKL